MSCPSCRQRKPRRTCPALGQTICTVCCGTKRLVEIACPADCVYLATARDHPAAVVRRQQEQDVSVLLPTLRSLTERQHQLFFLFQTLIARYSPDGFARLVDADVTEAAAALAATLETSSRGVIYEHAPQSRVAQSLIAEMKGLLDRAREEGASIRDSEAVPVLRAIERGARESGATAGQPTAYLDLMARLLQVNRHQGPGAGESNPASSLIVP